MIKRLRMKFVAIITAAMLLVFFTVFVTLNLFMRGDSFRRTDDFLRMVADNDGFFLPPRDNFTDSQNPPENMPDFGGSNNFNPEMMRAGRFFYVKLDSEGKIFETNLNMMFDFSKENAAEYVELALAKNRDTGKTGNFNYLIAEKNYGKIAVFAERSIETGMLGQLAQISIWAAGAACLIIFVISIFLSNWVINPVRNAFKKQRRFTSDASHELKTPLTVISANADVLESEIGENMRINNIKSQLARMSGLIHDLLTLAKSDENVGVTVQSKFDLSKAALNTALEFESRAFEEEKKYEYDIEEDIIYTGDEKQIKQLLSILIDNAIRHSGKNDVIKVSLSGNSGKAVISVYNTGTGVPENETDKIFDRFYRSDISRSRETGGYGLGLAIAKSISDAHKGSISVKGKYGKWVEFLVTI